MFHVQKCAIQGFKAAAVHLKKIKVTDQTEYLKKLINDGEKAENKMCDHNYQLLMTMYHIKYNELSN